jgi:hypothetical protein
MSSRHSTRSSAKPAEQRRVQETTCLAEETVAFCIVASFRRAVEVSLTHLHQGQLAADSNRWREKDGSEAGQILAAMPQFHGLLH